MLFGLLVLTMAAMAGLTLSEATLGRCFFDFFVACHGDCGKSWSELKWIQSTKETINQKAVTKTKSLHVFTLLRCFLFANTTVFGIAKWMTMNFGRPEIFTLFGIDVTGSLPKKPVAIWVVRTFPPCGSKIWRNFE